MQAWGGEGRKIPHRPQPGGLHTSPCLLASGGAPTGNLPASGALRLPETTGLPEPGRGQCPSKAGGPGDRMRPGCGVRAGEAGGGGRPPAPSGPHQRRGPGPPHSAMPQSRGPRFLLSREHRGRSWDPAVPQRPPDKWVRPACPSHSSSAQRPKSANKTTTDWARRWGLVVKSEM